MSDLQSEAIPSGIVSLSDDSIGEAVIVDGVDIRGSLKGLARENIDELGEIYLNHARLLGFNVRRSKTRTNQGVISEKYFVCSCEGFKRKRERESVDLTSVQPITRLHRITRTGCQAFLRVKRNSDNLFEVVAHVVAHNHPLFREEHSHFHRSGRHISNEKGKVIESMMESGLKPLESFRLMDHEAGGEESVGHTLNDHYNYCTRVKAAIVESGDAQHVIDCLHDKSQDEPDFFYKFSLDENCRLKNLFWRDSMMKEDYSVYGDVLVFDTTYRINKYNLICAPFSGINCHRKNVIFGCAFLSDETTETFVWLFETFKKSMLDKSPITIFTDQDPAMSNAIHQVFPNTRHRLCLWHLYKNGLSQFGKLKNDKSFNKVFNKCLCGCSSPEEFQNCWEAMLEDYGLEHDPWFNGLYAIKDKWSTAFSKDFFSAGILSSERAESMNHSLGIRTNNTTSLTDFFRCYNERVFHWRSVESHDEFMESRSSPESVFPLTGLIKHASEVYTFTVFRDFESKFIESVSLLASVVDKDKDLNFWTYSVTNANGETNTVIYEPETIKIDCDCKRLSECWLFCSHCLRVLNVNNVIRIPDRYVNKRWTKTAKSEIWDKVSSNTSSSTPTTSTDCVLWRHCMSRKYYNLFLRSQSVEAARKILEEGYSRDSTTIDVMLSSLHLSGQVEAENNSPSPLSNSSVQNLPPSITAIEGCELRVFLERKQRKKSDHQSSK